MELSERNNNLIIDKKSMSKRKLALIYLSTFLVFIASCFVILISIVLNSSSIYHGILIDGNDVGGYTEEKLSAHLFDYYAQTFDDRVLTISSDNFERKVSLSELNIKIDATQMAKQAFETGREGNVLQRVSQLFLLLRQPVSIDLILDTSSTEFSLFLNEACERVYQEIVPPNIIIMEDSVLLCTGIAGKEADRNRLEDDVIKWIQTKGTHNIELSMLEKLPPPIDVDTALETLNQNPVDAQFIKTSRTTYEIKTHQMGRKIGRDKLIEIINYVNNREEKEYEELVLPVEFIEPELTEEKLKSQLFRDTLASYTTHFNTNTENNYNRGINIRLAANSIDGTLLLPGEEFSFNDIVGPRTTQKGYQIAHIFVDGQIRDGTGGGVCQVSTTLYNAVLRANLPVSQRHNHMFVVGYVPLGTDAAVSYGYADLVFKNTTAHPLRISATVSENNNLTFRISSANDYPNLKVKLATKTTSTTPITTKYIDDYTLPMGTEIVSEKGSTGYVVDTYMKVFNGDILLSEEKLHRSVYQMLPRKIRRGAVPALQMAEELTR